MDLLVKEGLNITKYRYEYEVYDSSIKKLIINYKCENCSEDGEQQIYLDKITKVYCSKCKKVWCIIPLQVNNFTEELIDFEIMKYYKVNKLFKVKQIADILDKITDKKAKDKAKLRVVKDYLSNQKYGKSNKW